MAPKFGTSGLRGLVDDLTAEVVAGYTRAFLDACDAGTEVRVGWDLRPSSPEIAQWVVDAVVASGRLAIVDGALPTPALAFAALNHEQSAVMVTGSHIPADRNGLKFYTRRGEISKEDEQAILRSYGGLVDPQVGAGEARGGAGAALDAFVARYVDGFGPVALSGLRVGVYQHSSVARDALVDIVTALGGVAVPLARSDAFIPVDTEAVDPSTRSQLVDWCAVERLDALVSTDGDADRPMVADAKGQIVPGDVLGALTARLMGADTICTPVSSNTMIAQMPEFSHLQLTRIGSPFVIAAMEAELGANPAAKVVGFEANGGFLLGFEAKGPAGPLSPLMTRDCVLPILAPLFMARQTQVGLAGLASALPERFTASDRLTGIEAAASQVFLAELRDDDDARAQFFDGMGAEDRVDLTDGLRVAFQSGDIVHLRPSGNAPEFRCYTEAGKADRAAKLLQRYLGRLAGIL